MQPKALLTWFACGATSAVTVGWLAARIHASGHAPLGLTSLGVGALLGVAIAVITATLRVDGIRVLIFSTLFFAFLTIAAEHAWLYRDFCRQWQEARTKSAAVAMFRPETPPSPREYFGDEWNPSLWIADVVIIVATAGGIAVWQRYRK